VDGKLKNKKSQRVAIGIDRGITSGDGDMGKFQFSGMGIALGIAGSAGDSGTGVALGMVVVGGASDGGRGTIPGAGVVGLVGMAGRSGTGMARGMGLSPDSGAGVSGMVGAGGVKGIGTGAGVLSPGAGVGGNGSMGVAGGMPGSGNEGVGRFWLGGSLGRSMRGGGRTVEGREGAGVVNSGAGSSGTPESTGAAGVSGAVDGGFDRSRIPSKPVAVFEGVGLDSGVFGWGPVGKPSLALWKNAPATADNTRTKRNLIKNGMPSFRGR
jgi:hypothetical protein